MKLNDKIHDRKIAYLFRGQPEIAFELGLLYFVLAKRKNAKKKTEDACRKSIYWLKKADVEVPEYLVKLSPGGLIEEIERLLVLNKAKIGARACEPAYLPRLCRQFGLA